MDFVTTKSRIYTCLLLFFLCTFSQTLVAEPPQQLIPVDEAERDLNFVAFRDRLKQIVQFREPERLVELLEPRVINGTDQERGAAAFSSIWRIDANDSEVWNVLDEILALGGGFVRSNKGAMFCAPYVFTNFPEDYDLRSHAVIIDKNVPLMMEPRFDSDRLAQLDYALIQVSNWQSVADRSGDNTRWLSIRTMAGQAGFVPVLKVRSPEDYHACFILHKKRGWRIFSLNATRPGVQP